MAQGFTEIPDWFSSENQGAGIAVAKGDLVVLMVDHPGQQANRGLYRIGKGLDAAGNVTAGWTPWIDVPDWFSVENQGADIAVADLFNNGGLDLVTFQIDNAMPTEDAGGQNQAFFRIDRGLTLDGAVAAPGTDWLGVPHWFSWETSMAASRSPSSPAPASSSR
jgi:hypothetical protein